VFYSLSLNHFSETAGIDMFLFLSCVTFGLCFISDHPDFRIIAKGASGGLGPAGGSSTGAVVRTVVELHRGQHVYALVGQEGISGGKVRLTHSYKLNCNFSQLDHKTISLSDIICHLLGLYGVGSAI
jgi:hypothetical protein